MAKTIQIRVKTDAFSQFRSGEVVTVASDDAGNPLDLFWRRRLRDAKRDDCCEVVVEAPKKKVTKRASEAQQESEE